MKCNKCSFEFTSDNKCCPLCGNCDTGITSSSGFASFIVAVLILSIIAYGIFFFISKNKTANSELNEIISAFSEVFQSKEKLAEKHFSKGWDYYTKGKLNEAAIEFKKNVELNPKNDSAYNNLAVIYLDKKMPERSAEFCKKAIEANPQNPKPYYNLSLAYLRLNKPDEALKEVNKAIELNPDYTYAYYNLGAIYNKKNMPDKAIEAWKKVIELKPDYGKVHAELAVAYYRKKEYKPALKHYENAVKYGVKADRDFLKEIKKHIPGKQE
ncbi:MAG: tetratricopeptide repeat protein [Armatimonadota bacterium]